MNWEGDAICELRDRVGTVLTVGGKVSSTVSLLVLLDNSASQLGLYGGTYVQPLDRDGMHKSDARPWLLRDDGVGHVISFAGLLLHPSTAPLDATRSLPSLGDS